MHPIVSACTTSARSMPAERPGSSASSDPRRVAMIAALERGETLLGGRDDDQVT